MLSIKLQKKNTKHLKVRVYSEVAKKWTLYTTNTCTRFKRLVFTMDVKSQSPFSKQYKLSTFLKKS